MPSGSGWLALAGWELRPLGEIDVQDDRSQLLHVAVRKPEQRGQGRRPGPAYRTPLLCSANASAAPWLPGPGTMRAVPFPAARPVLPASRTPTGEAHSFHSSGPERPTCFCVLQVPRGPGETVPPLPWAAASIPTAQRSLHTHWLRVTRAPSHPAPRGTAAPEQAAKCWRTVPSCPGRWLSRGLPLVLFYFYTQVFIFTFKRKNHVLH